MGSKIVNISLPESLLSLIDAVADEESRTRSEFFREAARRYIEDFMKKMSTSSPGHKPSIAELRQRLEDERQSKRNVLTKSAKRAFRNVRRRMRRKKIKSEQ